MEFTLILLYVSAFILCSLIAGLIFVLLLNNFYKFRARTMNVYCPRHIRKDEYDI